MAGPDETQAGEWEAPLEGQKASAVKFTFPDNFLNQFLFKSNRYFLQEIPKKEIKGYKKPLKRSKQEISHAFSRNVLDFLIESDALRQLDGGSESYLRQTLRDFMKEVLEEGALPSQLETAEFCHRMMPFMKSLGFALQLALRHLHAEAAAHADKVRFLNEHANLLTEVERFRERIGFVEERALKAEEKAGMDSLTKLQNRGAMEERMAKIAEEKPGDDFVFMIFDLDKFKALNELHGHPAGDAALTQLAGLLGKTSSTLRYEDICRWGGDEFVVVLPNGDGRGDRTAELIRQKVEAFEFNLPSNNGETVQVKKTLSIGLTHCKGADLADGAKKPYREADHALHLAKGHLCDETGKVTEENHFVGRNRTVVFGDPRTDPTELFADAKTVELELPHE